MAAGTDTFQTHGVPRLPADGFLIQQQDASTSTDIMTVQAATSGTGDYIVCRNASSTEHFVVDTSGNVTAAGTFTATGGLASGIKAAGIGSISVTANATTASFAITNLTTGDVVILTKKTSAAGSSIMVDGLAAGTLFVRTFANESSVPVNYLVIGRV